MKKKVKIAQIGVGYWGPNLLRNVVANPKAELVALCDIDQTALQRIADKHPEIPQFTSFDEILNQSEIQAVILATPSELHFEQSVAALQTGKHVLVEKPMAISVKQANEIVETAEKTKRILMVGHTFLYNNIVREVKKKIDSGELGHINYIYSQRLNLGPFRNDTDVLWTLAPHDVSILNYWLESRPTHVSAHGRSHVFVEKNISDVCFCLLEYPNGICAHLHLSWMDPQKVRQMVLVGNKKMLIYDDMNPNKHIQIFDKGIDINQEELVQDYADFKTRLRAGNLVVPSIRLVEPLSVEVEHFINCIIEDETPFTDGRHGLEVISVLEKLTASIQNGGSVVSVDYPD